MFLYAHMGSTDPFHATLSIVVVHVKSFLLQYTVLHMCSIIHVCIYISSLVSFFGTPYIICTIYYLTQDSCSLRYEGRVRFGFYAVAIQVEDFASASSSEALSSVPVQFLVEVVRGRLKLRRPNFVRMTPSDGKCISIAIGSTYKERITARTGARNVT